MITDPPFPCDYRTASGFGKAIQVSVALHLGVLGLVFSYSVLQPRIPEPVQQEQGITVMLTAFNPLSASMPAPAEEQAASADIRAGADDGRPSTAEVLVMAPQEMASQETDFAEPAEPMENPDADLNPTLQQREQGDALPQINPQALQSSWAAVLRQVSLAERQRWLQDCVEFRSRNIFAGCPEGKDYLDSPTALHFSIAGFEKEVGSSGAPAANSSYERFRTMTQTDLFNPDLLSGEIALFSLGGGLINSGVNLLGEAMGLGGQKKQLPFTLVPAAEETGQVRVEDGL